MGSLASRWASGPATTSQFSIETPSSSVAETAQLHRRHGGHGGGSSYRKNVCLITLNGSLNGLCILNILNGFGGF